MIRKFAKNYLNVDRKPAWAVILKGAAVPGIIVTFFAVFMAMIALFSGETDLLSAMKFGVFISMIFCLVSALYITFELMSLPITIKSKLYLTLGYILMMVVSITILSI